VVREATVNLDLAVAGALALLQLVGVGTALAAYARLGGRRVQRTVRGDRRGGRPLVTLGDRGFAAAVLAGTALLLGVPLAQLVVRAFTIDGGAGIANFTALSQSSRAALGGAAWPAIGNSLQIALTATVFSLVIGLLTSLAISHRETRLGAALDTLVMLPLGTSAVTIGFGFLVAFDWPIDLRTSPLLIPLAHSLIAVPFVVRITLPVLRSIRTRLREAATVLGASPRRILREIDLPIVSRAALLGAGFAFAVSIGEFGATAFLVRPDRQTMTTTIFRLLGRPGQATFGQAMAMSVILMVVTAAAILTIDRFRAADLGEF
jgi:thiamine transport system permease protein